MVTAKVWLEDRISGADADDEGERRLHGRYPGIGYVFLDPTRGARTGDRPGR